MNVAICALALSTLFWTGLAASAQAQADGQCIITRVEGEAIVSARGVEREPAVAGLGLGTNAKLRTGIGARVTMTCSGGLRTVVGPESEFDVAGILQGGDAPFGFRLLHGIAGFLFDGDGSRGVQVRTPSAVAAVRSTEWAMQVEGNASAVFAREGTVFVTGDGDSLRLGPGDGVDVAASGAAGSVARWGQARIDAVAALLGPDW